jgi:YidC/Oxa1 family membrane protein insertase
MPATQSNPAVRLLITILVIGGALGLITFLFTSRTAPKQPTTGATPAATTPATDGQSTDPAPTGDAATAAAPLQAGAAPPSASDTTSATPDPAANPTTAPVPGAAATFTVRVLDSAPTPTPLGSLDPDSDFRSLVEFTLAGAGVQSITLANYFETVQDAARARHKPAEAAGHYRLQSQALSSTGVALVSLAANSIEVNGQSLGLFSSNGRAVWRETAPGQFLAEILDTATGAVALRLTREYTLPPDSYTIAVRQRIENLTGAPVAVRWYQFGPVDLNEDPNANNTPTRRIRFGFLLEPRIDPSQSIVRADSKLTDHNKTFNEIVKSGAQSSLLWPNPGRFKDSGALSWVAQTSRYFAFAVHPLISNADAEANLKSPAQAPLDRRLTLADQVHAQALGTGSNSHIALEIVSPTQIIQPTSTLALDFAAYAGPLSRDILGARTNPVGRVLNLVDMVVFQLGFCGFCAFQPIARVLLASLRFFHDYIVFDWGFAIILLVIVIRSILHPVFKRSQISMMRFSRQMQRLAPKQKALQQKFKDDPKKLREEQVRLMREENVNYAGMLGCIPMFLQTPIWIALYAMLFFAFDLRHQPAFFGVFQAITNSQWMFLADLSRPDNFIPLPISANIPLLGRTTAINILPLILGVVFYLHQKVITPTTATQLSPEQEQAQKIAKIMMVVMFPLFMYNQSSGLCLYFVTNSCVAIIESKYIRKHADSLDLDAPTKPRPPLGRKPVANTASNPFRKQREGKRFKDRG